MQNLVNVRQNNFGLAESELGILQSVVRSFPEIERVGIFGSRALGTYKKASDIDIVLYGKLVDRHMANKVASALEDSILPYFVDVVAYNEVRVAEFKEHIDKYAKDLENI